MLTLRAVSMSHRFPRAPFSQAVADLVLVKPFDYFTAMNKLLYSSFCVFLIFATSALGQAQLAHEVDLSSLKSIRAITLKEINVRRSPPKEGFVLIQAAGDVLFKLPKDARVTILDARTIKTLFDETVWAHVRATNPTTKAIQEGWSFIGDSEDKRFQLLDDLKP
jgi:hypothetical protein